MKENKKEFRGDICGLMLESPTKGTHVAFIDIEDWDKIKSIYWRVYSPATRPRSTYVIGWDKKNKRDVKLHRVLLDAPRGLHVDHINGNGLDNRRENLRLATHKENCRNSKLQNKSLSGLKGVHITKSGLFQARINWRDKDGKLLWEHGPKYFKTPEEAALCYNAMATKRFGEFAGLNNVESYVRTDAVLKAIKKQSLSNSQRGFGRRRNKTTGYYGVCFCPAGTVRKKDCFQARARFEYKMYYLGQYDTKEEAARAYDKKAKELFGEFAHLNFPDE